MAALPILPQTTYAESSRKALTAIAEDDNEDLMSPIRAFQAHPNMLAAAGSTDNKKTQRWLVPAIPESDAMATPKGFPTPRGGHFMLGPTIPESPSDDGSISQSSSSNPSWYRRHSAMTDVTEFDDLDDSSSDDEDHDKVQPRMAVARSQSQSRRTLPPLLIPASQSVRTTRRSPNGHQAKKSLTSPIPPTPSSAVVMSPAMFSFMQTQHSLAIPTLSAPPSLDGSLDGSLTSEQLANISAPPTPVIYGQDPSDAGDWSGVHLQPGALATLNAISGEHGEEDLQAVPEHEQVIEVPRAPPAMSESRPQRPRLVTNLQRAPSTFSPAQRQSLAGLTRLDIPSPGGFFSGLSPRTRTTWHLASPAADDVPAPSSATAEQFYRISWNVATVTAAKSNKPVERALHMASGPYSALPVEQYAEKLEPILEDENHTARRLEEMEPVTAKRIPSSSPVTSSSGQDDCDETPAEIISSIKPAALLQHEIAVSHLDRTQTWLMAQTSYLQGVGFEASETVAGEAEKATNTEYATVSALNKPQPAMIIKARKKKSVRFSKQIPKSGGPRELPGTIVRQESAFYRAFQDYAVRSVQSDVFVHRFTRFEALQIQRVSLKEQHRNQLLGKYQLSVVPQSAKKRMSTNVARGDDTPFVNADKLRADKELEAMAQMHTAVWHVAAIKLLNGGRLIAAPLHKKLARLSSFVPITSAPVAGGRADRLRILDLGGQATCDWAWHVSLQYPNAKIYTVTTKTIRQLSNSNIRGPPNHRQIAVQRLTVLPFPDGHFDLISARELHSILKAVGENGEDEWNSCLKECMRVLKPGGYLEFAVMDSEIINAGPRGNAKIVEFGYTLNTLGFDPNPTRSFIGHLNNAGFEGTRRAWTCLPLGPEPAKRPPPIRYTARECAEGKSPEVDGRTVELQAMVSGSTEDLAAVAGLAAGLSWERWLLRCEMEKGAGELRLVDAVNPNPSPLASSAGKDEKHPQQQQHISNKGSEAMREAAKSLDGVHDVLEEGRRCKAAWRVLKGYARKPDPGVGLINMVLDF